MKTYFCSTQGAQYALNTPRWRSETGELLNLSYPLDFAPNQIVQDASTLWRYRAAFPLDAAIEPVSMGEGMTPLQTIPINGHAIGWKIDYLFPSGSYKDRGATLVMTYAKALGIKRVVQDSSGNAGCAIAHYAALAGIECEIFVPADTSPAKLIQIEACGAKVNKVPGSREATAQAAMQAAEQTFYASHVWQPMFFQGTKTWAYEVCEQRGWRAPDTAILPAGNGTLLIGAYIGFQELLRLGITDRMPKLVGIQAAHCAPLVEAVHQGKETPVAINSQPTVAEGIAIEVPRRGAQMIAQIQETGGRLIAVNEEEITEALAYMTQRGHFIEPTSAAVVAGVQQYVAHYAKAGEDIVSVLTGHGLKAAKKIHKMLSAR